MRSNIPKYHAEIIDGKRCYLLDEDFKWFSWRYGLYVKARAGERFDGVTGWRDIESSAWLVHDILCRDGIFSDGTKCTAWQCMMCLFDRLREEGRLWEGIFWPPATLLFGGGRCRENGLFWLKDEQLGL